MTERELEIELTKLIITIADDYGLEVRTDYSGRGMYGKTCMAVVGRDVDFWQFTLALGGEFATHDEGMEMLDMMGDPPSRDNMGLSMVWYWPGLQFAEEVNDG